MNKKQHNKKEPQLTVNQAERLESIAETEQTIISRGNLTAFAQNLRAYRKAAGLTQGELAQLIGVDQSIISKYEKGENSPRVKRAEEIAAALHCSVLDLYHDHLKSKLSGQIYKTSVIEDLIIKSGYSLVRHGRPSDGDLIDIKDGHRYKLGVVFDGVEYPISNVELLSLYNEMSDYFGYSFNKFMQNKINHGKED